MLGVLALLLPVGAGFFLSKQSYVTCYVMSPMFSSRNPDMVPARVELLDKFRARGLISEQTYTKTLAAMEPAPTTAPSTQDAEEP